MAEKNASMFWLKHIVLALLVILAAIFVLRYNPEDNDSSIQSSGQDSETRNSVADNVTRFYEEFRVSSRDPIQEQYGDYVLPLEMPEESQQEQLTALPSPTKIRGDNWAGEYKFRAFPKQSTIKTEALRLAEEEGVTLLWDLDQDFVIRQRFLTESTYLDSLEDVAGAIDANFIPKVDIYFCNKKNAVVITAEAGQYILENCKKHGFVF
jgi:hypothetical protein